MLILKLFLEVISCQQNQLEHYSLCLILIRIVNMKWKSNVRNLQRYVQ